MVIEGEHNHLDGMWKIIIPSHPNNKKIIQTNDHNTTAPHAGIYATTI